MVCSSGTSVVNARPERIAVRASDVFGYGKPMASRICWNCEQLTHMAPIDAPIYSTDGDFWTHTYRCDSCFAASVAKMPGYSADPYLSHKAEDVFEEPRADIDWLPATVRGRRFEDVPSPVRGAASEAYECQSIRSFRAAILMARSVVEAVAKDQGVVDGSLVKKIDALAERGIISTLVKDTAHEIRHMGNEMAHGDFVQDVTEEECDDVLNFMSVLLDAVYQQPAKLTRFRAQRQARTSAKTTH